MEENKNLLVENNEVMDVVTSEVLESGVKASNVGAFALGVTTGIILYVGVPKLAKFIGKKISERKNTEQETDYIAEELETEEVEVEDKTEIEEKK